MTKSQGGFGDVTGNLRSSIGYFILKDGKIIIENRKLSTKGTDKITGYGAAIHLLNEVQKITGYQLIGVAGMGYAAYVESLGYNVITIQADVALINLKTILRKAA